MFSFLPSQAEEAEMTVPEGDIKGYPPGVRAVLYDCTHDGSKQPTLFWAPDLKEGEKAPLLVGLHTWSGNYLQAGGEKLYADWCQANGWIFLHPDFRGPNRSPEAMGSDLAVLDIHDAVQWAKGQAAVDEDRVYLVGVSGGGHAALLAAGRFPELWAGVSAWCGISDIAAWHRETTEAGRASYAKNIEQALGGAPDESEGLRESAWHRSPLKWLSRAGQVPLDIQHGITDGRTGSVPFTHSLRAWNAVVDPEQRLDENTITTFYETQDIPLLGESDWDGTLYGSRIPVFRLTEGNTRLTIFQGGHEIVHNAALNWLAAQRRGQAANWNPEKIHDLEASESETQSGK